MLQRLGLKIGDIVLMGAILLLAAALFLLPFLKERGAEAEIVMEEGQQTRVISLAEDGDYELFSQGVRLTVTVAEGQVSVSHADCPDLVCRNTPAISRPGQSIVCVPAGVVVRILGEGAAVDAISG